MSLLFHKDGFGEDSNYAKAENIRVLQVLMGYGFFIFHGSHFWGLNNAILFFSFCLVPLSVYLERLLVPKRG